MSYRIHTAGDVRLRLGRAGRIAPVIGGEWDDDELTDYRAYHLVLDDPGNDEAWIVRHVTPARLRTWAARLEDLAGTLATMVTVTVQIGATSHMPPAETLIYANVRIPAPPLSREPDDPQFRDWAWDNLIEPFLGDDYDSDGTTYPITILASDDPSLIGHVIVCD